MSQNAQGAAPRRRLAVTALVLGIVAVALVLLAVPIAVTVAGPRSLMVSVGLGVACGVAGVVFGVVALIASRARLLAGIGLALGLVSLVGLPMIGMLGL